MSVYRVNDLVKFTIALKVRRVFAYRDNIYYVVEILQKDIPWKQQKRLYGTLDYNGNPNIPDFARVKADILISELENGDLK